ncbi:MAG: hypothetical protein GY820_39885 [Gammaproteobacteria bacterium]|nr:hypothetical protein [Gammaproteobacteria bacterium]
MKKKPWLKFYAQDWLADPHLSLCDPASHGLLINLMALAHGAEPYGCLINGERPLTEDDVRRVLAWPYQTVRKAWAQLAHEGRIKRAEAGHWYIPRMVKDRDYSMQQSLLGKQGGNPTLKTPHKPEQSRAEQSRAEQEPPNPPRGDGKERYITARGKVLTGKRLKSFRRFWNCFGYKRGMAKAADSWLKIPVLTDSLVDKICKSAEAESRRRPEIIATDRTPKMAQGWITDRRWEDEGLRTPREKAEVRKASRDAQEIEAAKRQIVKTADNAEVWKIICDSEHFSALEDWATKTQGFKRP